MFASSDFVPIFAIPFGNKTTLESPAILKVLKNAGNGEIR